MKLTSFLLIFFLGVKIQLYAQAQPNFVFIVLDDCNDWVQGFSGHAQTATPNIQYLEKKGTTFTNAYVSAPQCAPSRTSFMTGKDCNYTQIYHNQSIKCNNFRMNFTADKNNEFIYTIPQILKDSGNYYTYSISKVLHCHEKLADFDSLTLDPCAREKSWSNAIVFDDSHGEEEAVEEWGYANEQGVYEFPYSKIPDSLETYMQDYIATDSAISFIQQYADDPTTYCDKPFFLALGYRRPHGPCYIPEKYFLSYENTDYASFPYTLPYDNPVGSPYNGVIMPPQPTPVWDDFDQLPIGGVARTLILESPVHNGIFNWANYYETTFGLPTFAAGLSVDEREAILEESKRANMIMGYLAAIKFVDAQIGRVVDELKTHPEILNNTVFVVVGDHGYSLGEKTHWKKGGLWETDVRAPMVIADMRAPVKKTCKRFVSFLDIFPTLVEMAGIEPAQFPDGTNYADGFSLTPLMANPAMVWNRPVLSSFINGKDITEQGACYVHYSIRDDEWHYIRYKTNGDAYPTGCDEATSVLQEELYHIGKKKNIDTYELNNLADDPAYDYVKDYLVSFLPDSANYLQFERNTEIQNSNDATGLVLNFYPNPASETILFSIENANEGEATLKISDLFGRECSSFTFTLTDEGFTQFYYPVSELSPGYYLAEIVQSESNVVRSFIVQR